jgi:uncharacterized membrane protein YuzA (DUF378 family)
MIINLRQALAKEGADFESFLASLAKLDKAQRDEFSSQINEYLAQLKQEEIESVSNCSAIGAIVGGLGGFLSGALVKLVLGLAGTVSTLASVGIGIAVFAAVTLLAAAACALVGFIKSRRKQGQDRSRIKRIRQALESVDHGNAAEAASGAHQVSAIATAVLVKGGQGSVLYPVATAVLVKSGQRSVLYPVAQPGGSWSH